MSESGKLPRILYGTAWKEDQTERLTVSALRQGLRGIDTANQRRHYDEAGVGKGLRQAFAEGLMVRDDLFLQTKFTFRRGQDHRLPYDPAAPIARQVEQSFASSLENLGVERLESYVLHGPSTSQGLTEDDWSAWRAMESLHSQGKTQSLGVSNVSLQQLELLVADAEVLPRFVQNRCYARRLWDRPVREFCREHGITYQGFSLLTANRTELNEPGIRDLALRHQRTIPQVVFAFACQIGMLPLTGTTSEQHMREDLEAVTLSLSEEELRLVEFIGATRL